METLVFSFGDAMNKLIKEGAEENLIEGATMKYAAVSLIREMANSEEEAGE